MSSSALRALRVLKVVGEADRPLGVTEIGRRLGIAAGTVFRSLDALERAHYVSRYQSSPRYVLGSASRQLRQSLFARFRIREAALPYLRQLAFASGETASLTVRLGWYGVRIAAVQGTNEVTNSRPLGETRPLGQGYASLAILGFLPPDAVARYGVWAARQGPATTLPAKELALVRRRGFALERTEFAAGRAALALPIRGPHEAVAAIAIEGPVIDLGRDPGHQDIETWLGIADAIGHLVQAQPALFESPFQHLDPDGIVLQPLP